jgi:shikimate dehydrogenase
MNRYGLIGYPLEHSFSQRYFTEKFQKEGIIDTCFDLFPIDTIAQLPILIQQHPDLKGLAVTIPYKSAVMTLLDEIESAADRIGAVNGISIKQGKLLGFNSDHLGFEKSLCRHLKSHHDRALILGTGGSSKAVAFVLDTLGIPFQFVSRNPSAQQLSYESLENDILNEFRLVINCTPVGMYPDIYASPLLNTRGIGEKHLLFDLIYNPAQTGFLKSGAAQGAETVNGLEMLYFQAEINWLRWNE